MRGHSVGGRASAVPHVFTAVVAALTLAACAGGGTTPTSGSVVLVVDRSLVPPIAALPPLDGRPRPLAVLEDADGTRAAFVADELWVATDDRASLDALLARWNGVVLIELDPAAAGVAGLARQYLVRIETALADVSTLSADLKALDPTARGNGAVSSSEGLGVLAAGAREAAAGHTVGVNWVGEGADVGHLECSRPRSGRGRHGERPGERRAVHPEPVRLAHARRRQPAGHRRGGSVARPRSGRSPRPR